MSSITNRRVRRWPSLQVLGLVMSLPSSVTIAESGNCCTAEMILKLGLAVGVAWKAPLLSTEANCAAPLTRAAWLGGPPLPGSIVTSRLSSAKIPD